jgi:pimeloyl-ACP methyl ester carboxylesterase/predicted amino acid-binding ACT domain protein
VGHHLEPRTIDVDGRPARYSVGGEGFPVVFLHGWGLAEQSYRRTLKRLVVQGCRVYAPSLPGFGATAALPRETRTIAGFSSWVARFMKAAGINEPSLIIGHSFGGGVAIRLTHDHPELVRYLVLLDSVGAGAWKRGPARRLFRPVPIGEAVQLIRSGIDDMITNLRHPGQMLELALLARDADLSAELVALAKRDMPVLVLWGDDDRVLPAESFESLCRAIGTEGQVIAGNHSWVLADPDAFGEVMSNVVDVTAHADTSELSDLLGATSMPKFFVRRLLDGAAPLWLMSEPTAVLAADLALCHPRLRPGELRAVARETDVAGSFRLTVVAEDRPGLLADTTAVLAQEGLSVTQASATTCVSEKLALHSLVVEAPDDFLAESWDILAKRLRSIGEEPGQEFLFEPNGRAVVRSTPQAMGRALLSVSAPDQIGLLWAICSWLADNNVTIDAMRASSSALIAYDEFVVKGTFDARALADRLSARHVGLADLIASAVGSLRNLTPF